MSALRSVLQKKDRKGFSGRAYETAWMQGKMRNLKEIF